MFVHFVCKVRRYLVGQYCKNEVFGLDKIVDDFDCSILHHLMENNLLYNNQVEFCYDNYLYCFYFVEKMGNFHFVLVRIVLNHENLLNLKLVVVYSDFLIMSSSEYSYWKVFVVLTYLHSYNYVQRNYFYVMFFVCMMVLLLFETFGNPFANFFGQQRVSLWIV